MLAQQNETLKETLTYLQIISSDEKNRMAYEARQMWIMDQRTREAVAAQEARAEEKRGVALAAIKKGIPVEVVADITGLSVEEINELAGKIQSK